MKNRHVYITSKAWFENTSLKDPIITPDHKLEAHAPEFYRIHYDTKLLVTKKPSQSERAPLIYDDHRKLFETDDISALDTAIHHSDAKNIFLNGFDQAHFLYIAPKIQDSAEVIYFFKCPKIHDLSALSRFPKLRCVHIFWNNALESLWDMTNNERLRIISFTSISRLSRIGTLGSSSVEYVCLDSSDNYGRKRPILFDASVFDQMQELKHLTLRFSDCDIDR